MKSLPKFLAVAALAAAVLPVSAAQAAAPWSDPVAVPGSVGNAGAPQVLITRTRGGAIAFNGAGSFPGAPTLRSILSDQGPLAAQGWTSATDFDTKFGSFAATNRIIYAGSNGRGRVQVGIAPGPQSDWTLSVRGPATGGARTATAASTAGTAAAFATFEPGGGYVYLVRQVGVSAPSATQRVSTRRGSIRAVSVATNADGDVLVAWDLHGTVQARIWYGGSKHFGPVQDLGTVQAAEHLSVALGNDRRATVAWIDQRVSEGNTGQNATVWATARSASRGFLLPAKQLDAYPDTAIPGGTGIQAAYTSSGRGIIAWSGRNAVRAALVNGRSIGAPQDLAPVAASPDGPEAVGLGTIAVAGDGAAAVTIVSPVDASTNQVLVAPLGADATAFGPTETVSAPGNAVSDPSAAFDPTTNQLVVAWHIPSPLASSEVLVATRPSP